MSYPLAHKIKRPNRYRDAAETSKPGYLERRMKAYARLQRWRNRTNVVPLRKESA